MTLDDIVPDSEWAFKNIKRENIIVVRIDKYGELIHWRYVSSNNTFQSNLSNFEKDFVKVE